MRAGLTSWLVKTAVDSSSTVLQCFDIPGYGCSHREQLAAGLQTHKRNTCSPCPIFGWFSMSGFQGSQNTASQPLTTSYGALMICPWVDPPHSLLHARSTLIWRYENAQDIAPCILYTRIN